MLIRLLREGRVRMIDFGYGYGRWQCTPALKHRQTRWSSHSRSQSRQFGRSLSTLWNCLCPPNFHLRDAQSSIELKHCLSASVVFLSFTTMQKSILCICAIALMMEVVLGAPFAEMEEALDAEDSQEFSKRFVRDILSPLHNLDKRKDMCPIDCFSCFKMIRNVTPDKCINGCKRRHMVSDGSYSYDNKMWYRCASYLQRPLHR